MATYTINNISGNYYSVSINSDKGSDTYVFIRNNKGSNLKINSPFDIFSIEKMIFPIKVEIKGRDSLLELNEFSIIKIKK